MNKTTATSVPTTCYQGMRIVCWKIMRKVKLDHGLHPKWDHKYAIYYIHISHVVQFPFPCNTVVIHPSPMLIQTHTTSTESNLLGIYIIHQCICRLSTIYHYVEVHAYVEYYIDMCIDISSGWPPCQRHDFVLMVVSIAYLFWKLWLYDMWLNKSFLSSDLLKSLFLNEFSNVYVLQKAKTRFLMFC